MADVPTIPSFARVEVRIPDKRSLVGIGQELRSLADQLQAIAIGNHTEEAAVLLSYQRIKVASQKLRSAA